MFIAPHSTVRRIVCERCQNPTTGKVYRVTSEEGEALVLNMIVCDACAREARRVGLKVEEIALQDGS